ncbi:hypothetical protein FH966_15760 [Lentibacillus cibarius]|uniref:Cytosolic protein n=1 Tax=Lentibacillus cibarius TaxID=2583219 RepID=A0A549YMG9_9BACI|nr:hypothetical protein [Lentibacillus cibarius]TMN21264.1 hypothetical protein FFL34_03420 [Lentibacillus cibarius]TRM13047.1 hypothetical protein FH966_15760 [Lentibacillus cibarius]
MSKKDKVKYSDFSNVLSQRNNLIPEEFPEGPFGSEINDEELKGSKSTPWKEGQSRESAFVYPDKEQHDDLPRQTPGAHPLHDETGDPDPEEKNKGQ